MILFVVNTSILCVWTLECFDLITSFSCAFHSYHSCHSFHSCYSCHSLVSFRPCPSSTSFSPSFADQACHPSFAVVASAVTSSIAIASTTAASFVVVASVAASSSIARGYRPSLADWGPSYLAFDLACLGTKVSGKPSELRQGSDIVATAVTCSMAASSSLVLELRIHQSW